MLERKYRHINDKSKCLYITFGSGIDKADYDEFEERHFSSHGYKKEDFKLVYETNDGK